jgi:uncharacterized protein (UPF0548 family)
LALAGVEEGRVRKGRLSGDGEEQRVNVGVGAGGVRWTEAVEAVWKEAVWKEAVWKEAVWKEAVWKEAVWREAVWKEVVWKEAAPTEVAWTEVASKVLQKR